MKIFQRILYILLISLFLTTSLASKAQKPNLIFQNLSIENGLSDNTVRSIEEDTMGFLWFGSEEGLNKYDGYDFRVYKHNPANPYSISNNVIRTIYKDKLGRLWIGTRKGLNLYDLENDRFYNHNSPDFPVFKSAKSNINGVIQDKHGNFWVAAGEEGLLWFDANLQKSKRYYFKSDDRGNITALGLDDAGNLIVGTRNGTLKFLVLTEKFIELKRYGSSYIVRSIYTDKTGNIWLSTSEGIKVISSSGEFSEYRHNKTDPHSINGDNIVNIFPYKTSFLVAIDGAGIDYFDQQKGKFYHYTDENESQLNSNNITCVFADSKGGIWAGTFLNGINFSNPSTNLFSLIKNNIYSDKVIRKGIITDFLKDRKGNLWISSDGGGIYIKKRGSPSYLNYNSESGNGLKSNTILHLLEDENGIWVSTYTAGLAYFSFKDSAIKHYMHDPANEFSIGSNKTNSIIRYQGKIWISTYGAGVDVLDPATDSFSHYRYRPGSQESLPTNWISIFYTDRKNRLWLGTMEGLSLYLPETNSFKTYKFGKSEAETNLVNEILQDERGMLWLGTGGGLIEFNPEDEQYKIFNIEDGLAGNSVKSIIEDNEYNLWMTTSKGISRFNLNSRKFKSYTIQDGIPVSSFYFSSKFKSEDGKILFGANNGILVVDPEQSRPNHFIPKVYITELKVQGEPEEVGKKKSLLSKNINLESFIELPYGKNSVAFTFTALNFNSPARNQYSYKLEGFDKHWHSGENLRHAFYTNLDPGTYVFKVRASNNDGLWNQRGTSITLVINPPFWKTWWFYILEAMLIIISIIGFLQWRTKNIRKKNIQLEELVIQRTKELKDSNDQLEAFVYKASHDIKGPLKSVIGLTTVGQKDVKDPLALKYFDHILKSTTKLDKLLMELLQLTKVKNAKLNFEQIDFEMLINQALSSFQHTTGYEEMKFSVKIDSKADFYSDKQMLYSVIQNLVENPIKYRDSSKKVCLLEIQVQINERECRLSFTDNGLGIPRELQERVFDMFFKVDENSNGTGLGLYIVKTSVEKLNGIIKVQSTPEKGSVFTVIFKNKRK